MQRMSPRCARASRAHFHNGLGTYYHRTYVRIYIYARARVTNRCITRRMHLAKVTCHSARFGLDGSLSKSNDTLRINLAGITGHCEVARRDTTMPSHMKAILQISADKSRRAAAQFLYINPPRIFVIASDFTRIVYLIV